MPDQEYTDPYTRMKAAVDKADEAFWAVIAEAFPEIKTGDVGPDFVMRREENNLMDVKSWIGGNAPIPQEGIRVRFKRDVDRFPHISVRAGDEGVVTLEFGAFGVQVDRYLGPGGHEWKNTVLWGDEEILDVPGDIEVIAPAEEGLPIRQLDEGDIVVFDDGIACPMRGRIEGIYDGVARIEVTRALNREMAERDPTFTNEVVELDANDPTWPNKYSIKLEPVDDIGFNNLVRDYWAKEDAS